MADKWIQSAIKPENKGKLRRRLKVKEGENIPESKLKTAEKSKGSLGKEARLAETLKKLRK